VCFAQNAIPPQQNSSSLAALSTSVTFEAKTVSNGGGVSIAAGPDTKKGFVPSSTKETRVSHPVIEVMVHNLAKQPANVHFDWFFIAASVDRKKGGNYVWDKGERDVALVAGGSNTENLVSKPLEQHTDKESHMQTGPYTYGNGTVTGGNTMVGTLKQSGSRPEGWIVRMYVGGALVKVQASTNAFEQIARDPVQLEKLTSAMAPR